MGGASSPWATPDYKTDPKEIFNRKLYFLVLGACMAGCFYGFDTGNIGGVLTLPSFSHAFAFDKLSASALAAKKGDIAAMLAAGAAAGSLLSAPISDIAGRQKALLTYGVIFIIGAVMQMFPNYPLFMAGRFIAGLAVGATSSLTPQYLAEWSPKSIRGSCVSLYNGAIVFCLALAFWINYAVATWKYNKKDPSNAQWQTSLGVQIIPGAIFVVMIALAPESARWLINHNKRESGLSNLVKIRKLPADHIYILTEYNEVTAQVDEEQQLKAGHSYITVLKEIFSSASNRRRLGLALALFFFHKGTGTDAINYFAPEIFKNIGVVGNSSSLLTTGVYGIVKLAATVIYVCFLIDRVGRRIPLLVGATIQATAMLVLGLFVGIADPVANPHGRGVHGGGIFAIISIYMYAVGWAMGHSIACYVVAAEIFPTRIRAVAMAMCLFFNWMLDYGITKATPSMLLKMTYGTYLFFAIWTYIGVVFIYFCLPELKGRSLESMDDLFQRPLWSMWKHAYPTEEEKIRHDIADKVVQDHDDIKKGLTPTVLHTEIA